MNPAVGMRRPLLAGAVMLGCAAAALVGVKEAASGTSASRPLQIVAIAAFVLVIARWPKWVMPTFMLVTWSLVAGDANAGHLKTVAPKGVLVLMAVAIFVGLRKRNALGVSVLAGLCLALPLMASGLAGSGQGPLPTHELRDLCFLVVTAVLIGGAEGVERTAIAICVLAIGLSIGAVYSVVAHPTAIFPLDQAAGKGIVPRAAGPWGESNFFALSLSMMVAFGLHAVGSGGWRRWLGAATLPALAAGIFATGSRGGMVAAGVALALYAGFSGNRSIRIAAVVAVTLGLAATQLFSAQLGDAQSRTVAGRLTENKIALAMWEDHPLLGVGPDEFPVYYRDYARRIGGDPRSDREPHSLPLQILAETGVVGAAGWLMCLFVVFSYAVRARVWRRDSGRMALVSLGAFGAGSVFLHDSIIALAYTLMGMLIALASET